MSTTTTGTAIFPEEMIKLDSEEKKVNEDSAARPEVDLSDSEADNKQNVVVTNDDNDGDCEAVYEVIVRRCQLNIYGYRKPNEINISSSPIVIY
jgi:hypothetical protein